MARRGEPLYAGLDLGTSSLKGVVVASSGAVIARARAGYPTLRPEEGAAEQSPADWLEALGAVVAALSASVPPAEWAGLGLAGMLPTLVVLDTAGAPAGAALTWEDGRAQHEADRLVAALGASRLYEITGQRLDGRYLLPMLARLARGMPPPRGRPPLILGAKDYVFLALTGELATDPSTAAGYGCYDLASRRWSDEIMAAYAAGGLEPPQLPLVHGSEDRRPALGWLAGELGLPSDLPVTVGAADSVLGAWAAGASAPGDVAYLAGTSTVVLGLSSSAVRDAGSRCIVTPLAVPTAAGGCYGLEMDLLATGSALAWAAELFGCDEGAVLALAAGVDLEEAPSFLAFLAPGEQGGLWEPDLRGMVSGLTLRHGRGHLARGLVSSIVLESRRCLAVLDDLVPERGEVLLAGHADSPLLAQDLADATGRRVRQSAVASGEHSAVGAAMLAAIGDGLAIEQPRLDTPCYEPRRAGRGGWERLWLEHERAIGAARALASVGRVPTGADVDGG